MALKDDVDQLRSQLSVEISKRPVAVRTEVDAINDRVRAIVFDRLEARIRQQPAEDQELFRLIQSLLPEKGK